MEFDAALARRNITINFVDKDYSKFSVFPVIASYFLDVLHLDKAFNGVLKMKRQNNSFSGTEYLLYLTTIIFLALKHIYKADDLLASETQLATILGFQKQRFPCSKSMYFLLATVDHHTVRRLDLASFSLIKQQKEYLIPKRWLVADIDQTRKLTEGKTIEKARPCYSSEKKGKLGLRLSASVVEGLVVSQKLEPGNVGNADAFKGLLIDTLQKLDTISGPIRSRRVRLKKIIVRIDGGYFAKQTFAELERVRKMRRMDFIMRVSSGLPCIKAAKKQKTDWMVVDAHIEVLRLPKQQIIQGWEKEYTVLLVREKRKKVISTKKRISHRTETIYYPLVTTLTHWHNKRIVKFYKKRQTIENIFKEFNQSFAAEKLPSHSFWGNALYFQMVSLVSNISLFFERGCTEETVSKGNSRNHTRPARNPRRGSYHQTPGYRNYAF